MLNTILREIASRGPDYHRIPIEDKARIAWAWIREKDCFNDMFDDLQTVEAWGTLVANLEFEHAGRIALAAMLALAPVEELWQRARAEYKWDMDRMPIG
jgi:hypothetical protein